MATTIQHGFQLRRRKAQPFQGPAQCRREVFSWKVRLVALPYILGADVLSVRSQNLPVVLREQQIASGDAGGNLGNLVLVIGISEQVDGKLPKPAQLPWPGLGTEVILAGNDHVTGIGIALAVLVGQVLAQRHGADTKGLDASQDHDPVNCIQPHYEAHVTPNAFCSGPDHAREDTRPRTEQQVTRGDFGSESGIVLHRLSGKFLCRDRQFRASIS